MMNTLPADDAAAESRRKKRHELSKPIPVVDTLSGETLGTLANLTIEGMLVLSNKPLDANRIYQVELAFPAAVAGADSVSVGIDCLWAKQGETPELNWAGCEIIDADADTVAIIGQLIDEYSTSP